ncbi:MAG TPA: ferritin-like domain-containing protein [Candidatus Binataceae bacterium]|nr:ferritin-like domain-containing protein [Candidatus Binataceae bacterium]
MDANTFVAELIRDNEELLARLAPAATLANEVGGDLAPAKLLRVALKNEIEASEIAAMWLPSAGSVALKLALARQAGDEAKHYTHIEQRLRELGDNLAGYDPVAAGYSPIFEYLKGLQTDVERVAAGQFTREAIAMVKNRQFIELCEKAGDAETARLYREVIEPDERFHHEMGVRFLRELAIDANSQALARTARQRTIELAEELQNAAFSRAKIHHAPGC